MSGQNYIRFPNRSALIAAACETSQTALGSALENRGCAHFLCSGGSTPGPLYTALSHTPLDWARITVGLTDERWVERTSEASNMGLLDRTLLQNNAAAAISYPMVTNPAQRAEHEAGTIDDIYMQNLLPADLMILGMGGDAHTLSWFAGAEGLSEALDPETEKLVTHIKAPQTDITGPHTTRLTLTRTAITSAREILLLITGEQKRTVFETATPDTPVAHMTRAAGDRLTTYWAP
jgi:6-phosphogluconolactonase